MSSLTSTLPLILPKPPNPTTTSSTERSTLASLHFRPIHQFINSHTTQLIALPTLISLLPPLRFVRNSLVNCPAAQLLSIEEVCDFSDLLQRLIFVILDEYHDDEDDSNNENEENDEDRRQAAGTLVKTALDVIINIVTSNPTSSSHVFKTWTLTSASSPNYSIYLHLLASLITSKSIPNKSINGRREITASFAAGLHNALIALSETDSDSETESSAGADCFEVFASDSLLVSNLLRSILPTEAVTVPELSESTQSTQSSLSNYQEDDSCTEWITRLLQLLLRSGQTSNLWKASGGRSESASSEFLITAECVVLLNVLGAMVDETLSSTGFTDIAPTHGLDSDSLVFLGGVFCTFSLEIENRSSADTGDADTFESGQESLVKHSINTLADILGSVLAIDGPLPSNRLALITTHPAILSSAVFHLEQAVNTGIAFAMNSKLKIDPNASLYKDVIIPMLNLISNISYANLVAQEQITERGLFAILNASSLGVQYLGVREYAIVAIRSLLDGNAENQKIVERLKAQEGAKSRYTEGMKINVDEFGKIKVVDERRGVGGKGDK